MFNKRKLLLILSVTTGFFVSENVQAQSDSVGLETVTIRGFAPERFMSGLKVQKMDSSALNNFRFQNISDLLSLYTPLAFKNYGHGQLNTVSFRGTSANHTAVLWNGLNINSPILGQTDFSTIPVAGFDELSVQYGSAASIVGSDAVGGSILLGSTAPAQSLHLSIGRQQESFNNSQTQLTAQYGKAIHPKHIFSGKTSVYDGRIQNNYPYTERRKYAILPSETFQRGLVQDLFFQSANGRELSAHVWLTENNLTLTPEDTAGREQTFTKAYRTMIRYGHKAFHFRTAWVRDIIDYAKGDLSRPDHAVTDKFSNRLEKDFSYAFGNNSSIQVKAGGEWTYYRAQVAGYVSPVNSENRSDLYVLTRLQATSRLLVSVNLRQAFVTRYNPPFTPSLGTEYYVVRNPEYHLKLKGSVGKSYRVPTLNERFWKDLGNPDIKPENGWNKEIGLEQNYLPDNHHSFYTSLTAYHNRVKDWTYWNASRNYRVENLQQVLAKGIELQAGWKNSSSEWKSGANLNYALNKSTQEKAYDAYSLDIIGKQLVFVPVHTGSFIAFIQHRSTRLTAQIQTTSKRFATFDNTQHLDGYMLANLLAETTLHLNKAKIRFQGQINNISDAFYLNVRNNAMPGRSFALSLIISYNQPAKIKYF
ncbi:TonB-dependent receptor plug domain-containing protein [Dyadobacter sediminis]|nr:TonB-dependent receptor plug domain-containing protein [Dyadobacter sediminis]